MFRVTVLLLALAAASRVERHEQKWGSTTCEELQTNFQTRLTAVRENCENLNAEHLSRGTRARLTMRMYGIGRTLRRASAQECQWVQDADNEHVQEARQLVETLMHQNPCADAARAEFAAANEAATEEERAVTMQRAMSILASDTCDPTDPSLQESYAEAGHLEDMEEQVQEGVEDLMDGGQGSSFAETNEKYAIERFVRFLVVLAIFVLLVVLCTWVVVWIGLFIISYFTMLLGLLGIYVGIGAALWEQLLLPPALLACGFDLFYRILNPEIQALPHHW